MTRLKSLLTFSIILAMTVLLIGMLSLNRSRGQQQTAGPEFDHPIMLCI